MYIPGNFIAWVLFTSILFIQALAYYFGRTLLRKITRRFPFLLRLVPRCCLPDPDLEAPPDDDNDLDTNDDQPDDGSGGPESGPAPDDEDGQTGGSSETLRASRPNEEPPADGGDSDPETSSEYIPFPPYPDSELDASTTISNSKMISIFKRTASIIKAGRVSELQAAPKQSTKSVNGDEIDNSGLKFERGRKDSCTPLHIISPSTTTTKKMGRKVKIVDLTLGKEIDERTPLMENGTPSLSEMEAKWRELELDQRITI